MVASPTCSLLRISIAFSSIIFFLWSWLISLFYRSFFLLTLILCFQIFSSYWSVRPFVVRFSLSPGPLYIKLNILTSETHSILNPKVAWQMKKKPMKQEKCVSCMFLEICFYYMALYVRLKSLILADIQLKLPKCMEWKTTHYDYKQPQTFIRAVFACMILNKLHFFAYLWRSYSEIERHYTHWNGQTTEGQQITWSTSVLTTNINTVR